MEQDWEERDRLAMEAAAQAKARLDEQQMHENNRILRIERRKRFMKTALNFAVVTVVFAGIIALMIPMLRTNDVPSIRKRNRMDIFTNIPEQSLVVEKKETNVPKPIKVTASSNINQALFEDTYAYLAKAEPAIESIRAQSEEIRKWLRD